MKARTPVYIEGIVFEKISNIKIVKFKDSYLMAGSDFGSVAQLRSNLVQLDFFRQESQFYLFQICVRDNFFFPAM